MLNKTGKLSLNNFFIIIAIIFILLGVALFFFLTYKFYTDYNKYINKISYFNPVSKVEFDYNLKYKAFEVDNKLSKYIIYKSFFINCDSCRKYINIKKNHKILEYFNFYKTKEYKNFVENNAKSLFNCVKQVYQVDGNVDGCKNFIKGVKDKHSNIINNYLTNNDIHFVNDYLYTNDDDILEDIQYKYNNFCEGKKITFDLINPQFKQLLCLKKLNFSNNNYLNLEDIRKKILFLYVFRKVFKFGINLSSDYVEYFNKLNKIKTNKKKHKKDNKKSILENINCYETTFNFPKPTTNLLNNENYKILYTYTKNNVKYYLCIYTKYNHKKLEFNKYFIDFLTDMKLDEINKNKLINLFYYNFKTQIDYPFIYKIKQDKNEQSRNN